MNTFTENDNVLYAYTIQRFYAPPGGKLASLLQKESVENKAASDDIVL